MVRRKVLVPLDGSEFSRLAFRAMARLFDAGSTDVTLVHVAPVPEGVYEPVPEPLIIGTHYSSWPARFYNRKVYSSQLWEAARTGVLDSMDEDAERLGTAGFEVTRTVRFGDPAQEIADLVEEQDFDAVVMATHGRSGVSRAVLGSVAEKVMRMVLAPVVMVRARAIEGDQAPITALQ